MICLQNIICTRTDIQKLRRIFAFFFFWRPGSEQTCRDNLFRSVNFVRLSLTRLFLSQQVSRLIFCVIKNIRFLGPTFVPCRLSWFSRVKRKEVWYLDIYMVLPIHLNMCVFSLEYSTAVSRKKLLKNLRGILFPPSLKRFFLSKWLWQEVLCKDKKISIPPCVKRFSFKLPTGTLPVQARLKECGMLGPWSSDCKLCKTLETIDNRFINCWDAFHFCGVLKRTIKKELNKTPQTFHFVPICGR